MASHRPRRTRINTWPTVVAQKMQGSKSIPRMNQEINIGTFKFSRVIHCNHTFSTFNEVHKFWPSRKTGLSTLPFLTWFRNQDYYTSYALKEWVCDNSKIRKKNLYGIGLRHLKTQVSEVMKFLTCSLSRSVARVQNQKHCLQLCHTKDISCTNPKLPRMMSTLETVIYNTKIIILVIISETTPN